MSFSGDVKKELSLVQPEKDCCRLSELAGLYAGMGSIHLLGLGRISVQFTQESMSVSRRAYTLLVQALKLTPQIHYVTTSHFGGRRKCVLTIGPNQSPKLMTALRMMEEGPDGRFSFRSASPRPALTRQCCMKAYLRGLMLSGGTMNPPKAGYHLELPCHDEDTKAAAARCIQKLELPVHFSARRGKTYLYLKQADEITTILTAMGAHKAVMEIEEFRIKAQVYQQLRQTANCDGFNLKRQAETGADQAAAIERLMSAGKLASLPPALQEIAKARLENPEASLTELGEMCTPPIGKSGVNHRLRRLMEEARTLSTSS